MLSRTVGDGIEARVGVAILEFCSSKCPQMPHTTSLPLKSSDWQLGQRGKTLLLGAGSATACGDDFFAGGFGNAGRLLASGTANQTTGVLFIDTDRLLTFRTMKLNHE